MKLVDIDEVIKQLPSQGIHNGERYNQGFDAGIKLATIIFKNQPAIDYEPTKVGHWIFGGGSFYDHYCRCSVCDGVSEKSTPFCPWCGADLKKKTKLTTNRIIDSACKR